jgi:16S rRNA C967 or C1407 C5-methylase (RsmB/RsmF family)/NOL1/NOP2/fmu family ribosome biogenesis protein
MVKLQVFNSYLRRMLPNLLIQSLQDIKGFDQEAFEAVHTSGEQVVSIRIHPEKWHKVNKQTTGIQLSQLAIHSSVPWCKNGYYLTERPSFTFDPVFHAGAYYVQEASSMFLWHVLEQVAGKTDQLKVLDLCAAPGGKSTLLSSYFVDGLVIANEVIKSRAAILTENITKWGSENVIVTNNDPNDFQRLQNYFDVIVVDAPCSGSGLFRKDPKAINEWSEENVNLCSLRQQRILADILPALKENGVFIYSTCSYSKQEDEDLLDWMIAGGELSSVNCHPNADWNIVETESPIHHAYGYRFYPDKIKGEGFFIAAFKKVNGGVETRLKEQVLTLPSKQELIQIGSFVPLPACYQLFKQNDNFRAIKENWLQELKYLAKHLYIKKAGVELGSIKGKDFIPSHELAVSTLPFQNFEMIELTEQQALQYLRKKEVVADAPKGWCMAGYCGLPLGWVKVLPNRINNYYPSEWRILKD